MTALIALVRKDLLLFLGDRRALLLNLLMPIVLGAFFGYLFGGSGPPITPKSKSLSSPSTRATPRTRSSRDSRPIRH